MQLLYTLFKSFFFKLYYVLVIYATHKWKTWTKVLSAFIDAVLWASLTSILYLHTLDSFVYQLNGLVMIPQVMFYEALKDFTEYGKQRWMPNSDVNSSLEGLVLGGLAGGKHFDSPSILDYMIDV